MVSQLLGISDQICQTDVLDKERISSLKNLELEMACQDLGNGQAEQQRWDTIKHLWNMD